MYKFIIFSALIFSQNVLAHPDIYNIPAPPFYKTEAFWDVIYIAFILFFSFLSLKVLFSKHKNKLLKISVIIFTIFMIAIIHFKIFGYWLIDY